MRRSILRGIDIEQGFAPRREEGPTCDRPIGVRRLPLRHSRRHSLRSSLPSRLTPSAILSSGTPLYASRTWLLPRPSA